MVWGMIISLVRGDAYSSSDPLRWQQVVICLLFTTIQTFLPVYES